MRARTTWVVLPLLLPLLAACGEEPSEPEREAEAEAAPDGWSTEHLAGDASVDHPTLLVGGGDDALVLMLSDDGVLQSHVSHGGSGFEAGEPLDLRERYAALGDVVRLDDGSWFALGTAGSVQVDGENEPTYDALALRSDDGLSWERVTVTGFTDAVELNAADVVDGRIVVGGDHRTLAADGGFEARVWTSEDGRTFEEVELPEVPDYQGYDDESYVGDVVAAEGGLLASGRIGGKAALWRSEDGGTTWSRMAVPLLRDAYSVSALGVVGPSVVASIGADDLQAIRSEDGGATWEPVSALPVNEETDGWAPLWTGGGRYFTLTGVFDETWSRPEVCYADVDQCDDDREPRPGVLASEDGGSWTAIEVPGEEEAWSIAGTDDGRVLVMVEERGGVAVSTWPAGAELPLAPDPSKPETVELVTLPEGEEPEVGVRYHEPMYVHCGMDWLWFGDGTWRRTDDGPGVETGAAEGGPVDWPLVEGQQTLYGYATVLPDGTLEYSTEDGTVIATYERRDGAPGCD